MRFRRISRQHEPKLAQYVERKTRAAAERAGNLESFAFFSPPALDGNGCAIEIVFSQHDRAHAVTGAQGTVLGRKPQQALDANLEAADDRRVVKGRLDFGERDRHRRQAIGASGGSGAANTGGLARMALRTRIRARLGGRHREPLWLALSASRHSGWARVMLLKL
jgi:hypothetical protein